MIGKNPSKGVSMIQIIPIKTCDLPKSSFPRRADISVHCEALVQRRRHVLQMRLSVLFGLVWVDEKERFLHYVQAGQR